MVPGIGRRQHKGRHLRERQLQIVERARGKLGPEAVGNLLDRSDSRGVVAAQAGRQLCPRQLTAEDENGASQRDDQQVQRQQDARPEMYLEERPAKPQPAWMMKK